MKDKKQNMDPKNTEIQATNPKNSAEIPADSEKTIEKNTRTFAEQESQASSAKADLEKANSAEKNKANPQPAEKVVVKKGGNGLALLAILIALGIGGAGCYFGQQQVESFQQKINALEQKLAQTQPTNVMANQPSDETMQQLASQIQMANEKISQLENELTSRQQNIAQLQTQVNKMSNQASGQSNDWQLSEADFLLTNALRKLVIDNDVDTSISLLKVAQEVLEKVSDPHVIDVRTALNNDLKQLLSVNNVDQNAIMQRLSQLANNVDELVALNVNFADNNQDDEKVSDDINDWQSNLKKSAVSFLNHFVRITPRNAENSKALLAPNQDIYLRENIRLRLQIAILAVPRQQNELYKQSLETVAAWVRSYFDTNTEVATNFLKSVDELADQSIYVELPTQLNSLNVLDKLLNKQPQEVQKIEISADKTLTEDNKVAAEEIKAEENATPADATKPAENQ